MVRRVGRDRQPPAAALQMPDHVPRRVPKAAFASTPEATESAGATKVVRSAGGVTSEAAGPPTRASGPSVSSFRKSSSAAPVT